MDLESVPIPTLLKRSNYLVKKEPNTMYAVPNSPSMIIALKPYPANISNIGAKGDNSSMAIKNRNNNPAAVVNLLFVSFIPDYYHY